MRLRGLLTPVLGYSRGEAGARHLLLGVACEAHPQRRRALENMQVELNLTGNEPLEEISYGPELLAMLRL